LPHVTQLLILNPLHLHMDIDAVHQRAGNTLLIACYRRGRTGARPRRVTIVPTWAGVRFSIKAVFY
jgi:hypothetical protein